MFHKESLSGFHDFKQKSGHSRDPTAGVNEAKKMLIIPNPSIATQT